MVAEGIVHCAADRLHTAHHVTPLSTVFYTFIPTIFSFPLPLSGFLPFHQLSNRYLPYLEHTVLQDIKWT